VANGVDHILNAMTTGNFHTLNGIYNGNTQILSNLNANAVNLASTQGVIQNDICNTARNLSTELTNLGYKLGDSENRITSSTVQEGRNLSQNVFQTALGLQKSMSDDTNALRDTMERFHDRNNASVSSVRYDLKDSIDRNGYNNLSAVERTSAGSLLHQERTTGEIRSQAERLAAEARVNMTGINNNVFATAKDLALEMCKIDGQLSRQASDNTAHVQIEALKNREALSRQMSECYCGIKELSLKETGEIKDLIIRAAGDLKDRVDNRTHETQQLIRAIENDKMRDALSEEKAKNLLLRLSQRVDPRCDPRCGTAC